MLRSAILSAIVFSIVVPASDSFAQRRGPRVAGENPAATAPASNAASKQTLADDWMSTIEWRSIGPANMSGRITSIAVYETEPRIWYIASASGGLLKTENGGQSFEYQFGDQSTVSIGDVQVCQTDPNLVWVGTGEANPRNSVSWGDGVYKSTDGGKTWKNMGLKDSFQIGKIAIHPKNPDVVFVGALGRLWGRNEERGLFKTTDGGKAWKKVLYVNDQTGVIDVEIHPKNPDIMLAATYERERDGFDGNDPGKKYGEGAGLYRSTDGGESFVRVTDGLPNCKLGRIGLDWFRKNPDFVYAIVESEKIAAVPANAGYAGLSGENADVGAKMTDVVEGSPAAKGGLLNGDIVIQVEGDFVGSYDEFLAAIRKNVAGDEVKLIVVRERKQVDLVITLGQRQNTTGRDGRPRNSEFTGTLGGQAANLQGQQGGENESDYGGIYMSADAGTTWKRINTLNPRPMYYSEVRVDPSSRDFMYVLGTELWRSKDKGETFTGDGGNRVHPDNHALWIDPKDGQHMIAGCDGGIYVTWNRMDNWEHLNNVAIGQFYHVGLDHTLDYKVYGGLQDNGSWGAPVQIGGNGPLNTDWFNVGGGDGFVTHVDPNDSDQIYFESQNGAMGRINLRTGERGFIRPQPPRGTQYRFNWKTPFILSPHNSTIHYSAGNYVFRSLFKGDKVQAISPDIANTNQGTGTAISESSITPGVIYVGTTDGAVWMTRDGGQKWEEVFVKIQKDDKPATEQESESGGGGGGSQSGAGGESGASEAQPESADAGEQPTDAPPSGETSRESGRRRPRDQQRTEPPAGESAEGKTDVPPETGDDADKPKVETESAELVKAEQDKEEEAKVLAAKKSADAEKKKAAAEKRAARQKEAAEKRAEKRRLAQLEKVKKEAEAEAAKRKDGIDPTRPPTTTEMPETGKADIAKVSDETKQLIGNWQGNMEYDQLPEDQRWIKMVVAIHDDGSLTGTFTTPRSESKLSDFVFNESGNTITWKGTNSVQNVTFKAEITDGKKLAGTLDMSTFSVPFTLEKSAEKTDKQPSDKSDGSVLTRIHPTNSFPVSFVAYVTAGQQDDPLSGTWKAKMLGDEIPDGQNEFELQLTLEADNSISGKAVSQMGELDVYEGNFSKESGKFTCKVADNESGLDATVTGSIANGKMSGTIEAAGGQFKVEFEGERIPEVVAADENEKTEPAQEAEPAAADKQEESKKPETVQEKTPVVVVASEGDLITGMWEGRFISDFMQGDRAKFTMALKKSAEGKITGWYGTGQGNGEIEEGKFDAEKNSIQFMGSSERSELDFSGTLTGERLAGTTEVVGREFSFEFEAKRTSTTYSESESTSATAPESAPTGTGKPLGELVPGPRWVSSLEASKHSASRVYITLDGHRSNDDDPYVFVSEDYGKSWSSILANVPKSGGSTLVIREDIENPDLLFLGCEFSAWVSIDRGKSWTRFAGGLPTVAVHDFAIHPLSGDVVAATHGRSLWVADVTALRKLRSELLDDDAALLQPANVIRWRGLKSFGDTGNNSFRGAAPVQQAEIYYYLGSRQQNVRIEIRDIKGEPVRSFVGESTAGLHQIQWDLRRESTEQSQGQGQNPGRGQGQGPGRGEGQRRGGAGVPVGEYIVLLETGGKQFRQVLEIQSDPNQPASGVAEEAYEFESIFSGFDETPTAIEKIR